MRTLILAALLSAFPALLFCQQTRKEITNSTTPADDNKPNSSEVPDVYAIAGNFERIVVLRFKFQTDLLTGIEKMVKEQKIRHGVILAGSGSLRGYHLHSVSNRDFPSKNIFVRDPTAPADLVSMNGYIIDGRVHAHVTLADQNHAFGGHLEPGTEVFTFAIVTVGVLDRKADLSRVDDKTYR